MKVIGITLIFWIVFALMFVGAFLWDRRPLEAKVSIVSLNTPHPGGIALFRWAIERDWHCFGRSSRRIIGVTDGAIHFLPNDEIDLRPLRFENPFVFGIPVPEDASAQEYDYDLAFVMSWCERRWTTAFLPLIWQAGTVRFTVVPKSTLESGE